MSWPKFKDWAGFSLTPIVTSVKGSSFGVQEFQAVVIIKERCHLGFVFCLMPFYTDLACHQSPFTPPLCFRALSQQGLGSVPVALPALERSITLHGSSLALGSCHLPPSAGWLCLQPGSLRLADCSVSHEPHGRCQAVRIGTDRNSISYLPHNR